MFISNLSITDRVDFQAAQTKMALVCFVLHFA